MLTVIRTVIRTVTVPVPVTVKVTPSIPVSVSLTVVVRRDRRSNALVSVAHLLSTSVSASASVSISVSVPDLVLRMGALHATTRHVLPSVKAVLTLQRAPKGTP